eukprot:2453652-Prymnesium_polylepis.1
MTTTCSGGQAHWHVRAAIALTIVHRLSDQIPGLDAERNAQCPMPCQRCALLVSAGAQTPPVPSSLDARPDGPEKRGAPPLSVTQGTHNTTLRHSASSSRHSSRS